MQIFCFEASSWTRSSRRDSKRGREGSLGGKEDRATLFGHDGIWWEGRSEWAGREGTWVTWNRTRIQEGRRTDTTGEQGREQVDLNSCRCKTKAAEANRSACPCWAWPCPACRGLIESESGAPGPIGPTECWTNQHGQDELILLEKGMPHVELLLQKGLGTPSTTKMKGQ